MNLSLHYFSTSYSLQKRMIFNQKTINRLALDGKALSGELALCQSRITNKRNDIKFWTGQARRLLLGLNLNFMI